MPKTVDVKCLHNSSCILCCMLCLKATVQWHMCCFGNLCSGLLSQRNSPKDIQRCSLEHGMPQASPVDGRRKGNHTSCESCAFQTCILSGFWLCLLNMEDKLTGMDPLQSSRAVDLVSARSAGKNDQTSSTYSAWYRTC